MSYSQPRPPMGMPSMGMQQGGYGFAPMGMMPMGMNMMQPPMMPPSGSVNSGPAVSKGNKLIPQEIPTDDKDDKPPVTTVFVGNISERAPDAMVRQMLQRCGNVLSWKRVQGASGKLQAFGFCEYEDPEATLRCIRLLNDWRIADKELVVKVDAKTKVLLEEYKKKKKAKQQASEKAKPVTSDGEEEKGESGLNGNHDDEKLDEFSMREDRVAKAGLDACMREYSSELSKEPPPSKEKLEEEKKEKRKEIRKEKKEEIKDQGIDDMELEEEKKNLINREIHKFRDAHKICSR